jgi:glycosyltransferase involved in cell wall biosynthesis
MKRLSGIVAATPIIENKLKHWNSNTISVCNYPLLSEMPRLKNENIVEKPNSVCYIGGLFESRGLFQMLDAVKGSSTTLELAGLFSPESLKEKAIQHPAWKNVMYHGFVNRKEVYQIISNSQAGLVVLSPTLSYVESLPIKMFEYMSSETPVICSDFPLWKNIIESSKCGICVNPSDSTKISEAINYIINHPDIAKEMGENGKNAILNKFNWEIEELKLYKLYHQLA